MAIREDLVASAVQFLGDPNVVSSTIENKVAFLRSKNLTQKEIDAALSWAASAHDAPNHAPSPTSALAPGPPARTEYYQAYGSQYPWQPQPPPTPKRDWRDWFIMGTLVGGLGYGCYALAKRYVYPMIAPPTPERLEEDKKVIDDQFQKVFALVEQLARDTEALKEADRERTARLDAALSELEAVTKDLRNSSREHDVDGRRIREEVHSLRSAIPKALEAQKEMAERRLVEVNKELGGLKTLISSMNSPAPGAAASSYLRSGSGNAANTGPGQSKPPLETGSDNPSPLAFGSGVASGRSTSSGSGAPKPSIPAWQLAMAQKSHSDEEGAAHDQAPTS